MERSTLMTNVAIITKNFIDEKTGNPVNYERLQITGWLDGVQHTLELKLEKSELLLAKILLSSQESAPETSVRKPTEEEIDAFLDGTTKISKIQVK